MKIKIAVIVGSQNDLKQCGDGLKFLHQQVVNGLASVSVYVKSAHRHTLKLLWLLDSFHAAEQEDNGYDVIIAGAGKAAVMPSLADAYLRNHLGNTKIKVIGVAFSGKGWKDYQAAVLTITQAPGSQVIYAGRDKQGFCKACKMACNGSLPDINLAPIPLDQDLSLEKAIALSEEL